MSLLFKHRDLLRKVCELLLGVCGVAHLVRVQDIREPITDLLSCLLIDRSGLDIVGA